MKIWCCGITSNELEKIKDLVEKTKDFVDGFIWCVDSAADSDATFKFLDENKKEGKILRYPWIQAHDLQSNQVFFWGGIQNEDLIIWLDSSELLTESFLKSIIENKEAFSNSDFSAVYCSGRPYVFKFADHLFFYGTPHWGIQGFNGTIQHISEDQKNYYIINKRIENPVKHWCWHNLKYYLYARSNQNELVYSKYNREIVDFHEKQRLNFRLHLQKLGVELSLDGVEKYFRAGNCTDYFIDVVESEFCLSEFFQTKILGMDFMTTCHPRWRWSYKHYLKTGQIDQKNLQYEGRIIFYNKAFGYKNE